MSALFIFLGRGEANFLKILLVKEVDAAAILVSTNEKALGVQPDL